MTAAPDLKEAIQAFQSGDLDRARAVAERGVAAGASPNWQHLLGLIHCRLGDAAAGVEHLRAAAVADPGNVAFQVMLARALVDSGQAAQVLAMPEPPAIDSPAELALWQARAEAADAAGRSGAAAEAWAKVAAAASSDWRAWNNLGNALAAAERWSEAGDALAKAAEFNPADASIRRNAGSAFAFAGRFEEALEHSQMLVSMEPGNPENHLLLARALASLQRNDEAIAEFEEARRLGGESVATELGLGRRYRALMRLGEAEDAFRRALALDPSNRFVILELGHVLERTNQLDALSTLLDDALAAGLGKDELSYLRAVLARREGNLEEARDLLLKSDPDEDPGGWYGLKARIEDALGNSAEAFEAAEAMNRTAIEQSAQLVDLEEWKRNAATFVDELRELADTITPGWASKVPRLADPAPKRVSFLVGFPRSGTTLLDTFLMGHPDVEVLEEKQIVGAAGQVAGPTQDLPKISMESLEKARATYLEALAEHVGPDFNGLTIDKYPLDMAAAPLIEAMFPGAPIIFAQRHPCDVVLSGFMQKFGLVIFSDIREAAGYYDAMMRIWTAAREELKLNVHTVVYEEMVRDPEATLRPLLTFLGLKWDDRLLDHQRTAKERGMIITPSYDQVTEPITTRASGRWKRYQKQLEPVLPILMPWAERLGYRD